MSLIVAVLIFIVCLISMLVSSEVLVRGLTRLGIKLKLTEGLLGLLTALGTDAPEISSAIASLLAGSADLGRGVVLGSNIFNLAMLLGLGAVLAGQVCVQRQSLALNGTMALLTLLIVAALLLGFLTPLPTILLLAVLFIPYVLLLGLHPGQVFYLPLPRRIAQVLAVVVSVIHQEEKGKAEEERKQLDSKLSWLPVLLMPLVLAIIVIASIWLVKTALVLATAWQLPQAVIGAVILAGLTGLPNAYAAARLALRGRGAAVVSETLNSNTINLLVGLALPALLIGMSRAASHVALELGWLFGMTVIGLLLLIPAKGMTRVWGAALIVLYLVFVVVHVLWPHV